ncbi:MAG: class I SAM-dependent methyltransferase [Clostridiales bacterium]|jgi:tRNA A22 N-methylase|nr:class I SAM-dependent methyltransferase [Clostridiales bacterium]
MYIKPDGRIDAALREAGGCGVLCDIGADHGKLPVLAVLRGAAKRAIATDISEKSLQKAVRLAESAGVSDRIEFRRGDGFEAVDFFEADVFVVAGMGGRSIADILRGRKPLKKNKFILIPHQNSRELRHFLIESGYEILKDAITEQSGKYYDVVTAKYIGQPTNSEYLDNRDDRGALYSEFGRDNFFFDNPDFLKMLLKKRNEFDNALKTRYNIVCKKKRDAVDAAIALYADKKKI